MTERGPGGEIRADDLRYLAVVADSGRLSSAAEALGVDDTTVSRRLRALEQAVGAGLRERNGQVWELTPSGHQLVGYARSVQDAVRQATRVAAGKDVEHLSATIRITAADAFGTLFVVPALAQVQQKHSDLTIELVTGSRELGLRDMRVDLAITVGQHPPTRLFTERLCEYDNGFYGSADYLATHGNPASLEELRRHRIIFFVDLLQQAREPPLSPTRPTPRAPRCATLPSPRASTRTTSTASSTPRP